MERFRELILTNSSFTAAEVDYAETNKKVNDYFNSQTLHYLFYPGFVATDKNGVTTTLGRGGSDFTAAIIASAVKASVLEIWTDVSGMMTADHVLQIMHGIIPHISYQEAMELSHFGAKVIYPPTIQPVMSLGIPVWIKNTFAPTDEGTLIESVSTKNWKYCKRYFKYQQYCVDKFGRKRYDRYPWFFKKII
jgi:aspartokinase/homoserine dehydrogenase 1